MKGDCLIVIPARYASTRFPGKVLARLGNKTVLEWCYRNAVESGVGRTVIATDDARVVAAARKMGAPTVLTNADCPSGSDRVCRAARLIGSAEPFVINLQADEPFIGPAILRRVVKALRNNPDSHIATAAAPITDSMKVRDPNCVKVVVACDGRALYFSRAPVPFHHPLSGAGLKNTPWLAHCGIYGYRRKALEKFVSLPPSRLERLERLEQLRALEAGMNISVVTAPRAAPAIDVPEDLKRAERYLRKHKVRQSFAPQTAAGPLRSRRRRARNSWKSTTPVI